VLQSQLNVKLIKLLHGTKTLQLFTIMIITERISEAQAEQILRVEEGQFCDVKSKEIAPRSLTKTLSALANSDGGDVYVGISENGGSKTRQWDGFENTEGANSHLQIFEELFPLGTGFEYEFLRSDAASGVVLHVQINKTQDILRASNGIPYIRRGAQNLPLDTPEKIKRLEYAKGVTTFEVELTNIAKEAITESDIIDSFISQIVPTSTAESWLKKQQLIRDEKPTVAGLLLFADEPQAVLPKRCGVKVYRYRTNEIEGFREALVFSPKTVEGCLYSQIKEAVSLTRETTEAIPRMGADTLEAIQYPEETLHEIITNAVIHRDYSIADDVHIRIFDNRIEVQSPGRLPAHMTIQNILDERFARNGSIVRILNKFPDPPNKDVGEGLNTAVRAMHEIGLKEPVFEEKGSTVLVTIKHEKLASPEEAIMDWLASNPTIKNKEARAITHVRADYQIKSIFGRMVDRGMIEQVPGTRTSNTAYRKVIKGI
jgi:ATP-dependent DNA helicase RecG